MLLARFVMSRRNVQGQEVHVTQPINQLYSSITQSVPNVGPQTAYPKASQCFPPLVSGHVICCAIRQVRLAVLFNFLAQCDSETGPAERRLLVDIL